MATLESEQLFEIQFGIGEIQQLGETPRGSRQIVKLSEGTFSGPKLRGDVLAGGGDWAVDSR